ncbi:uncharacterized protein TM35_000173210 [Trypanosoma theileri]|uniref:Uncharacterized protein n=1 Tax=Trypanosoma theileri TaxID=67003 RepID=A0A1X0NW65_9TRYP|nr:uncharacterized protein TM35_000173210 [Trypanosoma theileri]ORC88449.1 hypothetical protein TM35_000173210 [Trypanosoma theileri]
MKSSPGRLRGKVGWTVENFAERIFISSPRLFSFSHRVLGSLRHPYVVVVVDLLNSNSCANKNRVEEFMGAFLQSREEEEKWGRVASMFDSKLTAEEVDTLRRKVSLNADIRISIEALWSGLGGVSNGVVKEDDYNTFHFRMYSYLLGIDNVSAITSTSASVLEDFIYDKRGGNGVPFGSFAVSMLELADNWTRTRKPDDYVRFLNDVHDNCLPRPPKLPAKHDISLSYEKPVYFSGGLVCRVDDDDHVEYVKKKLH